MLLGISFIFIFVLFVLVYHEMFTVLSIRLCSYAHLYSAIQSSWFEKVFGNALQHGVCLFLRYPA